MKKHLFIKTFGCAMNERDSENMIAQLSLDDEYVLTNDYKIADLIILNTCSVREKPVFKLFSELGRYKKHKKQRAKIGVCGCIASHMGREIIKKAPYVDFVLGARNISKINQALQNRHSVYNDINYDDSTHVYGDYRASRYKALINITIGCDKKCSFCIVPNTRGEEISIPYEKILDEVKRASLANIKEVCLLGQNVNGYGKRFSDKKKKSSFIKLLKGVSKIDGIDRIRFTSPHPLHIDDELIEVIKIDKKICKSIHMPLQSGSDRILKLMRRGYTKEWFLQKASKLRKLIPKITISTDIIVGFPGETDRDFQETIDVLKEVKFEHIYSFKYSKRPNTLAATFKDNIDEETSSNRLYLLQDTHKKILDTIIKRKLHQEVSVYFDTIKQDGVLSGRSDNNFIVDIKGDSGILGEIRNVKILGANKFRLYGFLVE